MLIDEKIERLMQLQIICIEQLNSIIDYIQKRDDVSVESHQDKWGGEENDIERIDAKN